MDAVTRALQGGGQQVDLPARNPRRKKNDPILAALTGEAVAITVDQAPTDPISRELQKLGQLPEPEREPSQHSVEPNAFSDTLAFGLPGLTSYAAAGMQYGADWLDGKETQPFDDYLMDSRQVVQDRVDARAPQMSERERGFYQGVAPMMLPVGAFGAGLGKALMPAAKSTIGRAMAPARTAVGGTALFGLGAAEGKMSAGPEVPIDDPSRSVDAVATGAGTLALGGLGMKAPQIAQGVGRAVSNASGITAQSLRSGYRKGRQAVNRTLDDIGDFNGKMRSIGHLDQQAAHEAQLAGARHRAQVMQTGQPELVARANHYRESGAYNQAQQTLEEYEALTGKYLSDIQRQQPSAFWHGKAPSEELMSTARQWANEDMGPEVMKARQIIHTTEQGLEQAGVDRHLNPAQSQANEISALERNTAMQDAQSTSRIADNQRFADEQAALEGHKAKLRESHIAELDELKSEMEDLLRQKREAVGSGTPVNQPPTSGVDDPIDDLYAGIAGRRRSEQSDIPTNGFRDRQLYSQIGKPTRGNILKRMIGQLEDGKNIDNLTGGDVMGRISQDKTENVDAITRVLTGKAKGKAPQDPISALLDLMKSGQYIAPLAVTGGAAAMSPGPEPRSW